MEFIFTYHAPTAQQVESLAIMGDAFKDLAHVINNTLPDGPGKTVAIRKLAEARMSANSALILEGKF